MMPISTTLPITASTMVTALGAELQAGSEGEKIISYCECIPDQDTGM